MAAVLPLSARRTMRHDVGERHRVRKGQRSPRKRERKGEGRSGGGGSNDCMPWIRKSTGGAFSANQATVSVTTSWESLRRSSALLPSSHGQCDDEAFCPLFRRASGVLCSSTHALMHVGSSSSGRNGCGGNYSTTNKGIIQQEALRKN